MTKIKLFIKGDKINTLNPYLYNNILEMWVSGCIYQGNLMYDENIELKGRIIDKISKIHNSINIKLKKSKWHDGKNITSLDFKFSLDLLRYNLRYQKYFLGIKDIKVVNERQINIKFNKFNNLFYNLLLIPIIPKRYYKDINKKDFYNNIDLTNKINVGCGPFVFDKSIDKCIVLKKNNGFHLGNPNIDFMEIYYGDRMLQKAMLKNKAIDFTVIDSEEIDEISDDYIPYALDSLATTILVFNQKNNLFTKKIRKSIDCIIDRDDIINKVYKGNAIKINQVYPKILCDKFNIYYYIPYSIDFEEYNYTFELFINKYNNEHLKIAMLIKYNLKQIGININIKLCDYKDLEKGDMYLTDLQHIINPQSNSKIKSILDKGVNNELKKIFNNFIYDISHEKIENFINEYREEVPFISILNKKEIQIIKKSFKNIKPDPRGILWNIHEIWKEKDNNEV